MNKDTVYRHAAIDAINALHDLPNAWLDCAVDAVMALPSAQPELQTAIQEILDYLDNVLHPLVSPDHWNVYSDLHDMVEQLNFCQNCGADMREEEQHEIN